MREYTLKEYQKMHGIKRIDFSKVEPSGLREQESTDELVCPYCESPFDYEAEDIDDILGGTKWQCPHCDKWFFAEGEMSINTWCKPIEDAVLEHQRHIEDTYAHVDKCVEKGLLFNGDRYGCVEWEAFYDYAMPLFENEEMKEGEK